MFIPLIFLLLLSSLSTATDIAGCGPNEDGKEFRLGSFLIRCTSNGKGGMDATIIKCIDILSNQAIDVGDSKKVDGITNSCELKDGSVQLNRIASIDN